MSMLPATGRSTKHTELESLWLHICSGDEHSFEALFTAYYARLCDFAEGILDSSDAAEDVVEEVFVRLWEGRESLEIRGSMRAFLYTAVRNRALNYASQLRLRRRLGEQAAASGSVPGMARPDSAVDVRLEQSELAAAIESAIEQLPPRCAEAFRLQRQHDLSYAEIAEVMAISPSTVEKHLIRALRLLRSSLAEWRT